MKGVEKPQKEGFLLERGCLLAADRYGRGKMEEFL